MGPNDAIVGSASRRFFEEGRKIARKIFVGNLHPLASEHDLESLFSEIGEITEVRLLRDREGRRSRSCGFVTFATDQSAALAVDAVDGRRLRGQALRVDFARERTPRPKPSSDEDGPRHRHAERIAAEPAFEPRDDYADAKGRKRRADWRRLRGTKRVV